MRTTLSIDDDILMVAKTMAERERLTIGEVISRLARQALKPDTSSAKVRNGIQLLPATPNSSPVTMELVNQLRDELP